MSALFRTALAAIGSISNFYFWLTSGYFEPDALDQPLLHTWSLGVEEQFYLIFPCLLIILAKCSQFARRLWILAILIISALASQWAVQRAPDAAFYLLPFRGFEFLLGAFVAILPPLPGPIHKIWTAIWTVLLAGSLLALFMATEHTPLPGIRALAVCGVFAGLLFVAPKARGLQSATKLPLLQFIGNASYALYLVHWPIIVLLKLQFPAPSSSLWVAVAGLSLTLVLGAGLHYLVERPYRYNTLTHSMKGPIALSLTAIFSMAAATTALSLQGLSNISRKASMTDKHVLLIGDSNADMYANAIEQRLRGGFNQLSIITSPGCPPLLGVRKIYNRENPEKNQGLCDAMLQKLETEWADHPAQIVILAARWEFYAARPVELRKPPRQDFLYRPGTTYSEDVMVTRKLFKAGIESMVSTLNDAGKTVIIIGQIPAYHNQPIRCARRYVNASPPQLAAACEMAKGDAIEKQYRLIRSRLDKAQKKGTRDNIYIDPVVLLCQSSHCEVSRHGRLLYQNGTHLNDFGAEIIIDEVAARFANELN